MENLKRYETDTHFWDLDETITRYARKNSYLWGAGQQNDSLKILCFLVTNKITKDFNYVLMENNSVIYDSNFLEDIGFYIDKLKVTKRFK